MLFAQDNYTSRRAELRAKIMAAAFGLLDTGEDLNQCRLARPSADQQGTEFSPQHCEADTVQRTENSRTAARASVLDCDGMYLFSPDGSIRRLEIHRRTVVARWRQVVIGVD
jgi:hypothetical protein